MTSEPLLELELPGIRKLKSGKVREIFDLEDRLLLVATDRISAFDCIMPNGIPRKGEVLTQLSHFWFDRFASEIRNHRLAGPSDPLPDVLKPYAEQLHGRSMIVVKAEPLVIPKLALFAIRLAALDREPEWADWATGLYLKRGLVPPEEVVQRIDDLDPDLRAVMRSGK